MISIVRTDVGLVRSNNEDSFLYQPPRLFAVADGMGGHAAGETASAMAVEAIKAWALQERLGLEKDLAAAIEDANAQIYQRAQQEDGMQGMGTTATVVLLEGNQVFWAHVGDSRLYWLSEGQCRQVTQDHTLVGEMVRSGNLTLGEAREHPRRNLLTRAVGTARELLVEQGRFSIGAGDYLLLCSDGLTGVVSEAEFQHVIEQKQESLEEKANRLLTMAKAAGAPDNVTFILLECEMPAHGA